MVDKNQKIRGKYFTYNFGRKSMKKYVKHLDLDGVVPLKKREKEIKLEIKTRKSKTKKEKRSKLFLLPLILNENG
ncbi:hypothetical protein N9K77_02070 [bacterium]|nr:hypothetical protein [bacterium]